MTTYNTIQFRRATAAKATTSNPVLVAGEPGYETDTKLYKIGDGVSTWSSLEIIATRAWAAARANHTGTQLMATISDAGALATLSAVGSAQITNDSIINADINSAAAIAYSKLSLTASIVNADVATGAAIALSKLAVDPLARANHTGTQLMATISDAGALATLSTVGSAQITDDSIMNADINSAAGIALSKLATDPLARANHTGTQLMATISDAGSLATLSSVTSAYITNDTIVDADINSAAAISLSKLAVDPLARANHTGTQLASTISNFDTQVRTNRLDQLATPTANVAWGSNKITGLTAGTASGNAAAWQQTPEGIVTTKGDLVVATGSGAVSRQGVGSDGKALVADASVANGVSYQFNFICDRASLPTGSTNQNMPRTALTSGQALLGTSGAVTMTLIGLNGGMTNLGCIFTAGGTALVQGATTNNLWAAIADLSGVVKAVTANDTAPAWAANTDKTFTWASSFTPVDGAQFFLALCFAWTGAGGVGPTLYGVGPPALTVTWTATPKLSAAGPTGQTTPPAVGATLAVGAAKTSVAYCRTT